MTISAQPQPVSIRIVHTSRYVVVNHLTHSTGEIVATSETEAAALVAAGLAEYV